MLDFGWYLEQKKLAEAGVFNLPNKTPMQSVKLAPLYDVLQYLSADKALNDYQNLLL